MVDPRQTAREHAAVELAFADGAEVESVRRQGEYRWTVDTTPQWEWLTFNYRVKPKVPREWWINRSEAGSEFLHDSKILADDPWQRVECVHVREVMEVTDE